MPRVLTEIALRDGNPAGNGKLGPMNTLFHFHIDLENFQRFQQRFQQSAKATQDDSTLLKKIGLALQYKSYLDRTIRVRSILDESKNGLTLLLELNNSDVIEVCKITFNPKTEGELAKRLDPYYLKNIEISNLNANENLKTIEAQDIDESIFERNALGVDIYPARFGKIPRTPQLNANKKELGNEEHEEVMELFRSYHDEIILELLKQQERLAQLSKKVETNIALSTQLEQEILKIGVIPQEECDSWVVIDRTFNIEFEAALREQQINDFDSVRNKLQGKNDSVRNKLLQSKNSDDKNAQSKAGLLQQADKVLAHNYQIFQDTDDCFKKIRAELVQVIHDTALQYFYTLLNGYKNTLPPKEADKFNQKFKNIAEITFDSLRVAVKVGPNVIEYQNKDVPKLNLKNLSLKNPETLETYIQEFSDVSARDEGIITWSPALEFFKKNFKKHSYLHSYCSYEYNSKSKSYKFTWTDPIIANLINPCSHEKLKSQVSTNKEFMDALEEKIQAAYHRATVASNTIMPIIKRIKAAAEKLKETKAEAKKITQHLNMELEKLISTRDQLLKKIISLNTIEDIGEEDSVKIEKDIKKLEKESNDKLEPIKAIALNLEQINKEIQPLTSLQKTEELYGSMLGRFNEVNLRLSFKKLNKVASFLTQKHEEVTKARLDAEQAERKRLDEEQAEKERLAAEVKRLATEKARLDAEQEKRERIAAKHAEIEKQRQTDVIDFAKKIVCFLNQLNYWSEQVKYGGGEKIEGTNFKVPRSIKTMHDSMKNISLHTYEGATDFINRSKEIVDNAGNGYACCFFKTRSTKTTQFYQLIKLFDINNPNNQDLNQKFKQMNNNWDTVWATYNSNESDVPETTVLVSSLSSTDSNPSTPRSLSRTSSMSSYSESL